MGQLNEFRQTDDEILDKIKIFEGTLNMLDNVNWSSSDSLKVNIFLKTIIMSINNNHGPRGYKAEILFVKEKNHYFKFNSFVIQKTYFDEDEYIYSASNIDEGINKMFELLSKDWM